MMTQTSEHSLDVGIVGAGQLAQMMLQAAIPLDISVRLLASSAEDSAARVAADVLVGSPDDPECLHALATACRVTTFDHELVPAPVLEALEAAGHFLAPSAGTMRVSQNKRLQRELFRDLGLLLPPFVVAQSVTETLAFAADQGYPLAVKAATGGYDGRGVWKVEADDKLEALVGALLDRGIDPVVESWAPIEREAAILAARRRSGEIAVYPLVETVQRDGMLAELVAPCPGGEDLEVQAARVVRSVAEALDVVGILAVEFFVVDDRLWINEIATRPHNSGHYTIEGTQTSQFEQHLRAILDWPLGSTGLMEPAVVTMNVTGPADGSDPATQLPRALQVPGAHVHLYGKAARPGRKLGHVTTMAADVAEARRRARQAIDTLEGR